MINLSLLRLPPDVFLRHFVVAKNVPGVKRILDVGSSLGELKRFLPQVAVTTVDVAVGADVVYSGKRLPFENNSQDVVVSVDTLEHIPPKNRLAFVEDLLRVADKKVIIIAPFGSPSHLSYEKRLLHQLEIQGKTVPRYLQEHVEHGLPTTPQLAQLSRRFNCSLSFIGWLTYDRLNWVIHTFEIPIGILNQIIFKAKIVWNIIANALASQWWMKTTPDASSRFLLIINK